MIACRSRRAPSHPHHDLIVAHFVLHDVDRAALPATLVALARSLRPGGRFVVVEPNTESGP